MIYIAVFEESFQLLKMEVRAFIATWGKIIFLVRGTFVKRS